MNILVSYIYSPYNSLERFNDKAEHSNPLDNNPCILDRPHFAAKPRSRNNYDKLAYIN